MVNKTASDYKTYQLKNFPSTTDFAVTVVMGCPFAAPFAKALEWVAAGITDIFCSFRHVTLHTYRGYHLHATVRPAVRTPFKKDEYEKDPERVNRKQRAFIEKKAPCYRLIEEAVAQTRPFEIQVATGEIKLTPRGEILLWGRAKSPEDKEQLTGLRQRLVRTAGCHDRDAGSRIHITLGTVEDFHRLQPEQKKTVTGGGKRLLRVMKPSSTYIDRVRLIYYAHRSLRRIVSSRDMFFQCY